MRYVISLMREMISRRKVIWDLSKADFKKRFVGSYFGIIWMFLQPVATVLVYFCVFQLGLKSTPPVDAPYVLWLVPGIVPWFFFSEVLNSGTGCLSEYSYLVKKVVFPVEILPVIKLISCLFVHIIFTAIMMALFLCYGRLPMVSWIQIIYYMAAGAVYSLAFVYFTCSINVFFKDMAQIVGICLQFGMWLTPIMYDEAIFTSRAPWLERVFKLNPFYYIAAGYRDSMMTGNWFFERPTMTVYFWAVTLILMLVGLSVFRRLRPHFSDVL